MCGKERSFCILKHVVNAINTVIDRVEKTTLKAYNCEKRAMYSTFFFSWNHI